MRRTHETLIRLCVLAMIVSCPRGQRQPTIHLRHDLRRASNCDGRYLNLALTRELFGMCSGKGPDLRDGHGIRAACQKGVEGFIAGRARYRTQVYYDARTVGRWRVLRRRRLPPGLVSRPLGLVLRSYATVRAEEKEARRARQEAGHRCVPPVVGAQQRTRNIVIRYLFLFRGRRNSSPVSSFPPVWVVFRRTRIPARRPEPSGLPDLSRLRVIARTTNPRSSYVMSPLLGRPPCGNPVLDAGCTDCTGCARIPDWEVPTSAPETSPKSRPLRPSDCCQGLHRHDEGAIHKDPSNGSNGYTCLSFRGTPLCADENGMAWMNAIGSSPTRQTRSSLSKCWPGHRPSNPKLIAALPANIGCSPTMCIVGPLG